MVVALLNLQTERLEPDGDVCKGKRGTKKKKGEGKDVWYYAMLLSR